MEKVIIEAKCRMCKEVHHFEVKQVQLDAYQNGAYMQDAFPEFTADDRELLISGTCGKCFDELFK